MAEAALSATQWVVAKALAPVTDGLLEAWEASRNFGFNIEALRDELLRVKATLEIAGRKEIGGPAMEELLQRLRDSAHNAKDLLDELDYFRIHDEFHNTHEAADEHGEGGVQDLARDARHTVKALGKQLASLSTYCFGANASHPRQGVARQHVSCCAWQCGRRRLPGDSSSVRNANQAGQEIIGCMPKLGKLFPGSSSPHPHVSGDEDRGNAQQTPKLDFNRVDFSQRMKDIVEKLQPVRKDVNEILQGCGSRIALDIAQRRPPTTPQSAEPKLYGRDHIMNNIIHDITEGQYCDKGLTVLPIIGPGGMGKTTLIQHIYNNQQVQNHFPVRIWICVSFNFNRDKVLEEIKRYTPRVEDEKESIRIEELIVQRLKSKRFLLVLDDIWHISNGDDWKKLLLTLGQSEKKGSMILVTTRQKEIAHMVKTTDCPKELNCLEPGEFRKLFIVYIFDAEQYPGDKLHLLDTGDEIMGKLKGSPLAAKTVGRLLRTDPSLAHWRRVLNSKQWAKQTNGIMPALELSYDFLPFHLQRCFSCSALFPEDYRFRSRELISLWIGLDILTPCDQNPTFEGIGLSILNDLVIHGFFREYKTHGDPWYVMHDLLHELALKVASHDCLSFRLFDVGSVEIKPSTRHLSISIENLGEYNAVSGQKLKRELEKLKTRLTVEHLQTLMLFGRMDEGFAKIFGDFFGEANALRVLYLPHMKYPVESMLHNFSGLVHLRFLCLGTWEREVHLPLSISKFYHLRVLDLQSWYNSGDFPEDMSNLAKLCNYYTPRDAELHSDICNVGKLKLLEKLKVFRVNKKSEGFEPKQLEHLTKLWELGIYNLEKIHTEDEAAQAKLIEKKCLRRLTLDWDSEQSSVEPGMEGVVLQSLQPHGDLQVLCIRGYGGPSCPTWLGDVWDLRELRLNDMARLKEFIIGKSFCMLIKLELIGLESFEKWIYTAELETSPGWRRVAKGAHIFPALQVLIIKWCPKILEFPISNHTLYPDWFPKLQELVIQDCPEFSSAIPISWIESLRSVMIKFVKLLEKFEYSKSSNGAKLEITGKGDLHSLDQVLVFDKETSLNKLTLERCPSLELKHLLMLTSLKTLIVNHSDDLVGPLGGQGDVEWQLPVEHMRIWDLNGNSGEELTELLPHLPKLSRLEIWRCKNIKKLVVGVDVQQTTSEALEMGGGEITAATEEDDDGVLLFPPHLCDSLRELEFYGCPELVLGKGFCMLIKLELIGLASFEKWVYPAELEASLDGEQLPTDAHMFPLLRVLIIRECPKFLEFPISNHILFPDWFPKLQELEIQDCPEFSSVISISWIESLHRVTVKRVKLLEEFEYSKSSDGVELKIKGKGDLHGLDQVLVFDKKTSLEKLTLEWFDSLHRVTIECVKLLKRFAYSKSSDGAELEIIGWGDLQSLDQVLVFDKETGPEKLTLSSCPPLELKHLLVLTSLKTLIVEDSDGLVGPLGGQGDVEWQLPVEHIRMCVSNGNSGEELTDLLPHLPKLSKLEIMCCGKIKKLVVGVDEQQTTSEASEMGGGEITAAAEEEDHGVLLFPPHLCDSLRELEFDGCPELVLVDPPTHVPGGGWLQALRSLQRLKIMFSPKFLSAFSFSCHIFPSSLQFLKLCRVEGMGTLEPLSNLSSLVTLELRCCGEDLECQGLQSLLTTGGQLNELKVIPSPRFFAGWNHNHGRALEDVEGEEQQIQPVSSTLQELSTDDAAGLLAAPICSFLSSSLTKLQLCGYGSKRVERFSKEQEDALQLLSSLQELNFSWFDDLQQLPAGLRNLTSLKKLTIYDCPAASSFPNDGLPKSLQKLNVRNCKNQELKQQCRGLAGAIPKIIID